MNSHISEFTCCHRFGIDQMHHTWWIIWSFRNFCFLLNILSIIKELRERVLRGKYRIPFYMSSDCEALLRKMLVLNPQRRLPLTVRKIFMILSIWLSTICHRYGLLGMKNCDWSKCDKIWPRSNILLVKLPWQCTRPYIVHMTMFMFVNIELDLHKVKFISGINVFTVCNMVISFRVLFTG